MDKNRSWMYGSRVTNDYVNGVEDFLNFAFQRVARSGEILCPCKKCSIILWKKRHEVHEHLILKGFMPNYARWVYHGEDDDFTSHASIKENYMQNEYEISHDMYGMVHAAFERPTQGSGLDDQIRLDGDENNVDLETKKFYEYLKDAEKELYPNCPAGLSKLSFTTELFNLKCLSKWSDKSFSSLLKLLLKYFPMAHFPKDYYETKKMISDLGFSYEKIDACPNDCQLYWNEKREDSTCSTCGESRWKIGDVVDHRKLTSLPNTKKIPAKVLRHFPLIPRLKRLFMFPNTASSMRWHSEKRIKDGKLRHPADSEAWKVLDCLDSQFAGDPRNVRLGLASDGFQPFNHTPHSIWPVILVTYNLPPSMCMKEPYFIMSSIIEGPSGPGNNIDVYLQPLIFELKDLWYKGVSTYDVSKEENFQLRAALLWTISDFPAYANLSGWSTKGRLACPLCNADTCSIHLPNGGKHCYMSHRRWLPPEHNWRKKKNSFNGKVESRLAPVAPSGNEVLEQIYGINIVFGKKTVNRNLSTEHNWKKKSIFFDLPYWKDLILRHNLDVMHIEKNVCESLLATLMNVPNKTKDNKKARQDLKHFNIRKDLHVQVRDHDGKEVMKPAIFWMHAKEKETFCNVLKHIKVPDGYSSNISRCVNLKERKISQLKSHDCHILMQQLLPIAIRWSHAVPNVRKTVIDLCEFFRDLCSKDYHVDDFSRLNEKIIVTLCELEMIFPPGFFDIMIHLPIHLADEARTCGPVQYRWMYPFERYMFKLKQYVRNRSRPEGSIAEGYIAEECMKFCSRYLNGVENMFNKPQRNIFGVARPLGITKVCTLDRENLQIAHNWVLNNSDAVVPYINTWNHLQTMLNTVQAPRKTTNQRNRDFSTWFKETVADEENIGKELSNEIKALARGPNDVVKRYTGYIINGFRFHSKTRDLKKKTQNSGVVVSALTECYSSTNDRNPVEGEIDYYGVLNEIVELDYYSTLQVVLFKCEWYDISRGSGIKCDEYRYTLVNTKRKLPTNEPYVLASQAKQVFYVENPTARRNDKGWKVVVRNNPKEYCGENVVVDNEELYCPNQPENAKYCENMGRTDCSSWIRVDENEVEADEYSDEASDGENDDHMELF